MGYNDGRVNKAVLQTFDISYLDQYLERSRHCDGKISWTTWQLDSNFGSHERRRAARSFVLREHAKIIFLSDTKAGNNIDIGRY